MNPDFVTQLQSIVGKDHVSDRQADTAVYAYDASLSSSQPNVVVAHRQ